MGYVLANDVFTSLVGVLMEKKMDAKELNSWGLMYAELCTVSAHTQRAHRRSQSLARPAHPHSAQWSECVAHTHMQ